MRRGRRVILGAARIFVCVLPMIVFCLSGTELMLPQATAICMHECAHLIALRLCGGKARKFSPAPFGLCIEYDANSLSPRGEFFVYAAGGTVNLLSAAVSFLLYRLSDIDILDFGIVSLLVGALNLLPIQPLDGGRLLFLLLSMWCGPSFAYRVTGVCTYLAALFLFLFASYMLLTTQAGLYPLLFAIFLFSANSRALERFVFA